MTNIIDFLHSVLGFTDSAYDFFFLILGGSLVLIMIDGILTFIFGGISSLTHR